LPSSLRRTFGSFLLRSGASVHEVSAAMGNSAEVVEEHYARILGSEVLVNLSKI
jgi:integrase